MRLRSIRPHKQPDAGHDSRRGREERGKKQRSEDLFHH
jgi:hypothetical protein